MPPSRPWPLGSTVARPGLGGRGDARSQARVANTVTGHPAAREIAMRRPAVFVAECGHAHRTVMLVALPDFEALAALGTAAAIVKTRRIYRGAKSV